MRNKPSAVIVGLGSISPSRAEVWADALPNVKIVTLQHPAASGRRFDKRTLGIGLDSLAVAAKAAHVAGNPILALNPWPAVACRLLTSSRNLACTGIYAKPGSRSWKLLRHSLGTSTAVVAMSASEATAWNEDGGRAAPAKWGGTFDLPLSTEPEETIRIFVGGTSDRDSLAIKKLVQEVESSTYDMELVIADGTGPRFWSNGYTSIRWLPFVAQTIFLQELARCHVSFLPLTEHGRAAGHMVLCASLEAGLPVLATPIRAMQEYMNTAVTHWDGNSPLQALLGLARADIATRLSQRRIWESDMSFPAHVESVMAACHSLGWPAV